jgi:hypothetical protein
MGLRNPMDGNRPYRIAWGVLLAHARHCGRLAALAMGLPPWLVEDMVFESEAVIEPVISSRGKLGDRALGARDVTAAEAQVPHVDFGGMQLLFSLSPTLVKSTRWFAGTYKPAADAEAQCLRADPKWSRKRMPSGGAAIREVGATLLQPAADLDAGMTHLLLAPGEGLATWGHCVHAGADNAAGVWRCMLFVTGRLPHGRRYNSAVQHLPFTIPMDVFGCPSLTRSMAIEYRTRAPHRHFLADNALAKQIERDCKRGRISGI